MRVITTDDLGALVRQERHDQGLTQAELAERIGTTRQWVSQFESGALNPRVSLVLAALAALELDLDVRSSKARAADRSLFDVGKFREALTGQMLARVGARTVGSLTADSLREQVPSIAATTLSRTGSTGARDAVRRIVDEQAERLRALEAFRALPHQPEDSEQ